MIDGLQIRRELAFSKVGKGVPMVLLHAFPLDREMWEPQIAPLSQVACILTLDLPGFGQSPPHEQPFTIDYAADQVAHVIKTQFNLIPVVVCGLSMGGYVAMSLARRHPSLVSALILADTRGDSDGPAARSGRDKMIDLAREKGSASVAEQMIPKLLGDKTRSQKPELIANVLRIASRQSVTAVIEGLRGLRDRPNAIPDLEKLTIPTLVIVGEEDVITPPLHASMIGARLSDHRTITIPVAGHLSNLENPEAFNAAVVEFLSSVN